MKKLFTLLTAFVVATFATTAQENDNEVKPEVEKTECTSFFKTQPIRVLMKMIPEVDVDEDAWKNHVPKDKKHTGLSWDKISDHGIPEYGDQDPALQTEIPWRKGTNMHKANWQGASPGGFPPDPTGAAGMNHYIQSVNSTYRVYGKDGIPEGPNLGLSTLWPGSGSDGDPIIMYDRYADRWFISQFQTDGSNEILIAVSETSDPLGAYYAYTYSFSSFPDYPKFGVWTDAYIMSANTNGPDCVLFEREKMLVGDASAAKINMYFPSMTLYFNSIAPAYAEGPNAPEVGESGWAFAVQDDSWFGVSSDHIKVLKIDIDWDTPANSDVYVHQSLNTDPFNSIFTSSWDDITQPGTSAKLDAVTGIFMYKAQWRRFDDYDVMILTHTVDVNGANRAGVRWYELRMDAGTDQWYIYQQSTFDPDNSNSRWMANAAMDLNGNIGMAYSISGTSTYPGLRFTGRFATDPLNTMTVQEQIAMDGTSSQTITNRYGDYSQMVVDPADDATFWFTGEYVGPGGSPKTRIFSFAMWELLGTEEPTTFSPTFNAYQPEANQLKMQWKDLTDDQFDVTVIDMNGKIVAQRPNVDATQESLTIDLPSNATGIYVVNIIGENTQLSDKIYLAQ